MMSKGFLFPGLRHIGYTSGFSIPLRGEAEKTPDLYAEVLLFSQGCLAAQHRIELGDLAPLFYRGWDEDWFPAPDRKSTRLNPVTNAHLVFRLLLEKKKYHK